MASLLTSIAGFRSLLFLAISLGVLSAQAGAGTLAVFTDTATSASNTFTTGSVDLQLNNPSNSSTDCTTGGGGFGNSLASALFNQSNLTTAGAVFTQSVCIKNNG
ncbi:MAG TPA: SipW-dependent-type signal peptide-containing protein, partial [Chloroflexota bacterium]